MQPCAPPPSRSWPLEPAERHAVFLTEHGVLLLRNPLCADCYGDWEFFARLVQ